MSARRRPKGPTYREVSGRYNRRRRDALAVQQRIAETAGAGWANLYPVPEPLYY